jgi:hypothetical protein
LNIDFILLSQFYYKYNKISEQEKK